MCTHLPLYFTPYIFSVWVMENVKFSRTTVVRTKVRVVIIEFRLECLAAESSLWQANSNIFINQMKQIACYHSEVVQTGSGAHPASWTVGTSGPFSGGKSRPGRDADHSPPRSAEVKEGGLCHTTPPWRVTGPLYFLFLPLWSIHCRCRMTTVC
jgi:hypothetical protein